MPSIQAMVAYVVKAGDKAGDDLSQVGPVYECELVSWLKGPLLVYLKGLFVHGATCGVTKRLMQRTLGSHSLLLSSYPFGSSLSS